MKCFGYFNTENTNCQFCQRFGDNIAKNCIEEQENRNHINTLFEFKAKECPHRQEIYSYEEKDSYYICTLKDPNEIERSCNPSFYCDRKGIK